MICLLYYHRSVWRFVWQHGVGWDVQRYLLFAVMYSHLLLPSNSYRACCLRFVDVSMLKGRRSRENDTAEIVVHRRVSRSC